MRNLTITSALAALALAATAQPAAAETVSIAVPYGDLNLSTEAGMATLAGRIAAASRRICGEADVRSVHDGRDHQQCVRQTRASVTFEVARLSGNNAVLALNEVRGARR